MGYNRSSLVVQRFIEILDQLLEAAHSGTSLRFSSLTPHKLAYRLREALKAAQSHEDYRHYYDIIWPVFQFREAPGAVIAHYVGQQEDFSSLSGTPLSESPTFSKQQIRASEARPHLKQFPSVTSLTDIVATALSFSSEDELFFPSATLSDDEKKKLHRWTHSNAGSAWTFIDHSSGNDDGGITLTQHDVDPDIAFHPSEE